MTHGGFVHDLVVDGMLHARVLRGAHPAARLKRVDTAALQALPGVLHVVRDGDFLALAGADEAAVVAAAEAARALVEWTLPVLPPCGEVEALLTALPATTTVAHAAGTAARVPAGRRLGRPVRVQWSRQDELTVAPVGPASLIELDAGLDDDGRLTDWTADVWSHTHIARPGWGAGGNLLGQQQRRRGPPAAGAATGGPPLPDTPAADPTVPGTRAVDPHVPDDPIAGAPVTDVPLPNGGGLRNALPGYALPALTVRHHLVAAPPLRTSALRSLGAHANVFAIESFIDELATLVGADAVAFRLAHLDDPRACRVVETAARLCRWDERGPGGEGRGLGLAYARYKNRLAYCALAVEVDVDAEVRVRRVWAAVDAGAVVHRDGLLNQVEGGIVQALSWSLKESVRWGPDGIEGRTWEDCPILGFGEVPDIVVELVGDDPGEPSLGAGELAPGPVAGALANAVAHALGLRARHLPLSPQRLLALVHGGGDAAT